MTRMLVLAALLLSACAPPSLYEDVGLAGFSTTRLNGGWETHCWHTTIKGMRNTNLPFEVSIPYDGEPAVPISARISDGEVFDGRPAPFRFNLEEVFVEVPGIEVGEVLRVSVCATTEKPSTGAAGASLAGALPPHNRE